VATTYSDTYASSVSILVQEAEEQFVALLADDEILIPIYKTAAVKLEPQRFERNFARILKSYADDLYKEATDDLQKAAIHLVRSRRKPTAELFGRSSSQVMKTRTMKWLNFCSRKLIVQCS
jgi:hypothetical protein